MRQRYALALASAFALAAGLAAGCGSDPATDRGDPANDDSQNEVRSDGGQPPDTPGPGPGLSPSASPWPSDATAAASGKVSEETSPAVTTPPASVPARDPTTLDCANSTPGGPPPVSPPSPPSLPTNPSKPPSPPPPVYPKACPGIYQQDMLPTFEVQISAAEWRRMAYEFSHASELRNEHINPKAYHPLISFRYGNELVSDAMIRLKGNPCCSWEPPKMQFVIAFDRVNAQGRFHGLRKISLDAPPYDPTLLRERLSLAYMRDMGVVASCANNARLVVNGEYYGLFVNIEFVDEEFLARNFARNEGNLYKAGHKLRTNEGTADTDGKREFWSAKDTASLDRIANLDQMIHEWALEAMIPDIDGFFAGGVNFYLYEHPDDGFLIIPWDADQTFSFAPVSVDPLNYHTNWSEKPRPFSIVLSDKSWRAKYMHALRWALEGYNPGELQRRLDLWEAQISEAVVLDPHQHASLDRRQREMKNLRRYFRKRADFVQHWLHKNDEHGGDRVDALP